MGMGASQGMGTQEAQSQDKPELPRETVSGNKENYHFNLCVRTPHAKMCTCVVTRSWRQVSLLLSLLDLSRQARSLGLELSDSD